MADLCGIQWEPAGEPCRKHWRQHEQGRHRCNLPPGHEPTTNGMISVAEAVEIAREATRTGDAATCRHCGWPTSDADAGTCPACGTRTGEDPT